MTREHYIPFNKEFLLEQQIAAFAENPQKVDDFKKLFEIIEHYYHYESFNLNRNLKQHYQKISLQNRFQFDFLYFYILIYK